MYHSKVKYKNLQHETNKQIFPKQKFLQSMLFSYRNIKKHTLIIRKRAFSYIIAYEILQK